ncbi:MAG: hypothetical protein HY674_11770, partial [Chloroflexi bacterium]|nr:hypothetical protein [Chloroflexota bacterium]
MLLPVITVMVLLLCFTMWMVNRRFTEQLQREATDRLLKANTSFANYSQKIRPQSLKLQYGSVPNETRVRAVVEKDHLPTTRFLLHELLADFGGDMVLFAREKDGTLGTLVSTHRDPQLDLAEFEAKASASARRALRGQPDVDMILASGRLYDIISVPVLYSSRIVGVLTFAAEIGAPVAQECKQVAHSEIVLLANDHVVVSTLGGTNLDGTLVEEFHKLAASPQPAGAVLNEERYWALAGHFATGSGTEKLGYLLLSSYETPLRELRTTQLRLFSVSLFGILLSSLLVWFLV